jgi:glucuronate isomerase
VFSRELGPLAGFYPCLYVGAPWWFLDSPDAVRRFRDAVTESAGFTRTSGFIDDTRAFCSIPARHDMSRRLDSGYLARSSPSTGSTRTRLSTRPSTWSAADPRRCSSCEQPSRPVPRRR